MSVLKKNIAANYIGSLWTGLMGLVFVPLYIRFIGVEAYGLVGIFGTLMALFSLLDMGLSNTLSREMARLAVLESRRLDMRDLMRTLEIPYWFISVISGLTVVIAAPLIADHWLNVKNLSHGTVKNAIVMIGILISAQLLNGFYSGGLLGLQRQVLANALNVIMASLKGVGAVLVLWLISPTVEAFFTWQSIMGVMHAGLVRFFLWHNLPESQEKPRFRLDLLREIRDFATSMYGITILGMFLTQVDKIVVSKLLSLEAFGYYTFAHNLAMTLFFLIRPITTAVYPKLTNLVSISDMGQLVSLYHKSSQLMSTLLLPISLTLIFFSKEIIGLWTQNAELVVSSWLLASMLMIAVMMNGIVNIPYSLTLAYGWTRLPLLFDLFAVLILVPLTIGMTYLFGVRGAATSWVILNVLFLVFFIPIMHKRLLKSEQRKWWIKDVGFPLILSFGCVICSRVLMPKNVPDWGELLWIILTFSVSQTLLLLILPVSRNFVFRLIEKGILAYER